MTREVRRLAAVRIYRSLRPGTQAVREPPKANCHVGLDSVPLTMESPHRNKCKQLARGIFALLLLGLCFVIKVRVTVSLMTFTAALMLSVAFINVQQSFTITEQTKGEVKATKKEAESKYPADAIQETENNTPDSVMTTAAPRVPLIRHDGVRPWPGRDSRNADWNL
mgnify:CR=1 FL=1